MVETDWVAVADNLMASIEGPSSEQQHLAESTGVELESWPQVVCAVLLRQVLSSPLHLPKPRRSQEGSVEFCQELASENGVEVPAEHLDDSHLTDAWISAIYAKRAAEALAELQPEVGDIVRRTAGTGPAVGEISSISQDGRLNFRGGFGRGVRPHRAEIRNRRSGDPDAWAEGRQMALEQAAQLHPRPERVGARERSGLDRYRVDGYVSEAAVLALQESVETAEDEKPLQSVLEQFPELLAHLVDNTLGAWVVPRPSLSGVYVPDFLVAAETSLGVRWLFVELEAPRHRLHLKSAGPGKLGKLSDGVRTGVAQIDEWREWVQSNLALARQPVADGGLGLAGIRPDAKGLVLVGRGHLDGNPDPLRLRVADRNATEIRTYDWLQRAAALPRVAGLGMIHLDEDGLGDPFGWGLSGLAGAD